MCSRYTLRTTPNLLAESLGVEDLPLFSPRHNSTPTQPMLAVRSPLGMALIATALVLSPLSAADLEPPYQTKYRVINVHLHCIQASEAAIRAELEVLDRVGVRAVAILDAGGPAGNLPDWMKLRRKWPDRLIVFWKLDFTRIKEPTFFADIVRDLEKAADMGVQGVKVWKDVGMYVRDANDRLLKADDPRLDPFWAKCGELGLPVLIHTADEKEYWQPLTYNSIHFGMRAESDQHYLNPEMPSWEEQIRQRDAVLKKHSKTNFIGAHVGSQGHNLKQLEETLSRYPNFFVDTSARHRVLGRLNPPAVRAFFQKHQDRLLFGTDGTILVNRRKKPNGSANISLYPTVDPDLEPIDSRDKAAIKAWQDRETIMYTQSLQYFETDRVDLLDPMRSGGAWLRTPGVKLPREVLEKFYHLNAERLIPSLASPLR